MRSRCLFVLSILFVTCNSRSKRGSFYASLPRYVARYCWNFRKKFDASLSRREVEYSFLYSNLVRQNDIGTKSLDLKQASSTSNAVELGVV
jgi:hypothetical protein